MSGLVRPTPSPILTQTTLTAWQSNALPSTSATASGGSTLVLSAPAEPRNLDLLQRALRSEREADVLRARAAQLEQELLKLQKSMSNAMTRDPFYYVVPSSLLPRTLYEEHRNVADMLAAYALCYRQQSCDPSREAATTGDEESSEESQHYLRRLVKQLRDENAFLRAEVARLNARAGR